jgi:hypothetical protein
MRAIASTRRGEPARARRELPLTHAAQVSIKVAPSADDATCVQQPIFTAHSNKPHSFQAPLIRTSESIIMPKAAAKSKGAGKVEKRRTKKGE